MVFYTSVPPMFVKIKTHKISMPRRPIVNRGISPIYFLEKFINSSIKPLTNDSPYVTVSSLKFLEDIHKIKLQPTAKFYSLDVKSLYPSVPLNSVKDIIIDRCKNHNYLSKHVKFIEASLNLIFKSNHFIVNNTIFQQTTGTPMGSCLAPTLGEITMQYIENTVLTNSTLKPSFYKRYVDDIFIIWEYTHNSLLNFVNNMNNIFDSINLTIEKEKDRAIPFLDILVHRNEDNNTIWTEVYHKPTSPSL